MDLTFRTEEGCFNCRAAAVILRSGRLLAMKDEPYPYYYLPGGRVRLHERAEDAIVRELREELGIRCRVVRPLWICQDFFTEEVLQLHCHELGFYFLVESDDLARFPAEGRFTCLEGAEQHRLEWLTPEQAAAVPMVPAVLKTRLNSLPEQVELWTNQGQGS